MEEQQSTQQPQAVINSQPPVQAKPPKKNSGIGKKLLLILLALILIAGAGFAGYTYANNQNKKTNEMIKESVEAHVAELEKQIDDAKIENQTFQGSQNVAAGHVVVDSWGIKFKTYDASLKYKIDGKDEDSLVLYSDDSISAGKKCTSTNTASTEPFGVTIVRSSKELKGDELVMLKYVAKVSNTYYYYGFPDGGCISPSATASDRKNFDKAVTVLTDTVKTLSAQNSL